MTDVNEQFRPGAIDESLLSGSTEEWYNSVLEGELTCKECEERFKIQKEHIGLTSNHESVGIIDKIRHKFTGKNSHNYDMPDYSVEKALFTDDGKPVTGLIQCPYCLNLCSHHHEVVKDKFSVPESEWNK
jgi:hypothetical protein